MRGPGCAVGGGLPACVACGPAGVPGACLVARVWWRVSGGACLVARVCGAGLLDAPVGGICGRWPARVIATREPDGSEWSISKPGQAPPAPTAAAARPCRPRDSLRSGGSVLCVCSLARPRRAATSTAVRHHRPWFLRYHIHVPPTSVLIGDPSETSRQDYLFEPWSARKLAQRGLLVACARQNSPSRRKTGEKRRF